MATRAKNKNLSEHTKLANRLLKFWKKGMRSDFYDLADEIIDTGDDTVFHEALASFDPVAIEDGEQMKFLNELRIIAEMDWWEQEDVDGILFADLIAISVIADVANVGTPQEFTDSLASSGLFPDGVELRIAPGWCRPQDLVKLGPAHLRRLLNAMIDYEEPDFLTIHPEPCSEGFSILIGIAIGHAKSSDDDMAEYGVLHEDNEELDEKISEWRDSITGGSGKVLAVDVVRPCTPSQILIEIEVHLEELRESDSENTGIDINYGAFQNTYTIH